MLYLKQSTAATIPIGAFVDATDGFTLETALTLSQADFRLSKNGGTFAQKNESTTAAHMENGWYGLLLDATDTNTIGTLTIGVVDTGARQVWLRCHVLAANVYDSLFGAATDKLDVNVEEWNTTAVPAEHTAGYPVVTIKDGTGTGEISTNAGAVALVDLVTLATTTSTATAVTTVNGLAAGVITAASIATDAIDADAVADGTITSGVFATGAITAAAIATDALGALELSADAVAEIADGVWDEARSGHTTAGTYGQVMASIINGEITASPTTANFIDTSLTTAQTGNYIGRVLIFTTGILAGQATLITGFNISTDLITFEQVTNEPSIGDKYLIV